MLKIDQILQGRYRIARVLGRGGMGAVYEARHIELDTVCVVKEMLPPDDAELVEVMARQFKREAKILANLRHPNLPHVSDYFTEGDNYYLVMDLISGPSLDKLIGSRGLPEATVLQYADQLLSVLEYVHTQGALHRDIKPANIIVQPDGRAVLVDFGLVKVTGEGMSSFSMRGLTPHYAPPEQYTGGTDTRSDLYSLAATLYQALSARPPMSAADQFAGQPLQSLRQLRPDISPNTAAVIEKTLTLDRMKRCQSAAEMRAALKGAAVPDNPTVYPDSRQLPVSGTKVLPMPQKQPMPRWAQITVGVMALGLVALLTVVVAPGLQARPPAAPTTLPSPLPTWTPRSASATTINPTVSLEATIAPAATFTPIPVAATLAPTATPVPTAVSNLMTLTLAPGVTMVLVRVPAGQFLMGSADSDPNAQSDEKPQHKVMLDEYLIGKYDVTNAQFMTFVKATGYKTTAEKEGSGYAYTGNGWADVKGADWQHPKGPGSDLGGKDNHPVVLVSWDDAVAFCAWVRQVTGRNVKLPTEAQWEKAARGTDGRIYPWGNSAPDATRLNFNMNIKDTTEVGKYSPTGDSPYGAADMAGNVWQWTADWYGDTYYTNSPASNPQGPTSGQYRVMRGGAWGIDPATVRAAFRDRLGPTLRYDNLGFRVVVASAPVP
ncbi:MAG: SUMF1/EgtB/PvdO family nonheme iron enzyme [Chloroflexi bacterium]|nr:SUMF1/EgtB/PvdO family nonheme iron enzyme [Chloroflexota bacterium]MCL5273522.1 SUMF1/EgtB/PvdO family nonheme iron enzyme [Chloroflexota bacterium]